MNVRAPAKVNLCLRLGPLRPDGYHRVTTLVQAIDVTTSSSSSRPARRSSRGFRATRWSPAPSLRWARCRRVRLEKRIPVASGLGGGSSDAAAVLRALRGERTPNELHEIARGLGTDVPFFLSGAETGFCTGRGTGCRRCLSSRAGTRS